VRRTYAIALALAALWSGPAAADQPSLDSARLWATVNVCDSVGHPDSIGIRGSMPGLGNRAVGLFMRFRVQYLAQGTSEWRNLVPGGDSGFVAVGTGRARARQFGQTFTITPPRAGQGPYVLRGLVSFEWRKGDVVLRRARRRTTAGHPNTAGADPPGFSAATCEIM
jgi:hypothetical protein